MSNKKFDLIEEFSKPIERDSSHNKVNTLSFLASTLIIVLAIGVYAFTIVTPNLNNNQSAKTIQSPVINEANNLTESQNNSDEQELHPQPPIIVFTKEMDQSIKDDITKQILDQTKSKKILINNINQNNTPISNPQSSQAVPKQLHIIEGQTNWPGWFTMNQNSFASFDGINWSTKSYNNPMHLRYDFPATFFKNKIYIASGWNGIAQGCLGDVWHSPTGKGWLIDTNMAPWTGGNLWDGRVEHTLTTANITGIQKMYMIAGMTCSTNSLPGDVWESTNGKNWNQLTVNNPKIGGRLGQTATFFKNKLFVIGGFTTTSGQAGYAGFQNDVLSSNDGINWNIKTSNAPWSRRGDHATFVFNNKLYVAGGHFQGWPQYGVEIYGDSAVQYSLSYNGGPFVLSQLDYFNDVWSSPDGVTWTQEFVKSAGGIIKDPLPGLRGHSADLIDGKIYVVGGSDAPANYLSDVYMSIDGKTWNKSSDVTDTVGNIQSMGEHASVVTSLTFGSNIPYDPPNVQTLNNYFLPNNEVEIIGSSDSTDPTTQNWFEYESYGANPPSVYVYGLKNSTAKINSISNFFFDNVSGGQFKPNILYQMFSENSAGMRHGYIWGTNICTNNTGPQIKLKSPHLNEILNSGQQYLLEWTSCNISTSSNFSFTFGINWLFNNNLLNDGNELITIPGPNPGGYANMIFYNPGPVASDGQNVIIQ